MGGSSHRRGEIDHAPMLWIVRWSNGEGGLDIAVDPRARMIAMGQRHVAGVSVCVPRAACFMRADRMKSWL